MNHRAPVSLAGLAVTATQAIAGQSVINTPLEGSVGSPFAEGLVHGVSYDFTGIQPFGMPGNLYDGLPTYLGGAATPGYFGPFGDTIGTFLFLDWTAPNAQWGDALFGVSADGKGPAVITQLRYVYRNAVATSTHTIKIYDLVSPGDVPPITSFIEKGAIIATIALPGQPSGTIVATITGLDILLPHSSIWMKFGESGPGFPNTLWLTGGLNGIGYSPPGVLLTDKSAPPYPYQVWVPYHYFYFPVGKYAVANLSVALSGYHVPAPPVIALLGIAGTLAMRRRRGWLRHSRERR